MTNCTIHPTEPLTPSDGGPFCRQCWAVVGQDRTLEKRPDDAYNAGGETRTGKRHKYGVSAAEDRTFGGVTFDSKVEMERYQFLLARQQEGEISCLSCQQPMSFSVKDERAFTLFIDFIYLNEQGIPIYEDVKGMASTPVFRLKKKLTEADRGIRITEVRKNYKTGEWIEK